MSSPFARRRRLLLGGTAALLLGVLVACSSTSATPTPAGGAPPAVDGAPGGSAILDASPERIIVAPDDGCPAPYDTRKPAAGENTGFSAGGQTRKFTMLLPPSTFQGPRPILFGFHGTSENGGRFVSRAKLADFAARGFIVVAPDAVGNGTFWPVWDGMRAKGTETQPNADVELFDRILSCTAAHYEIDRKRVYAAGHSAGGIFTNRLLRSRSAVLAGGIVGSGVFDLTASGYTAPLDKTLAIVTWGGDNDTYRGSTPSGVSVPMFSFVEQASLATKYYDAQPNVGHVRCRGNNLGHAWLPLNAWFIDLLLSHPKGSSSSVALTPLPGGAPAVCSTEPYDLPLLPAMTCGTTARVGCQESCQLFADCAVENRTVGPSLSTELSKIGFTETSCAGCVSRCQSTATSAADAVALACFDRKQAVAQCGPGIEGASPLFNAINECCKDRPDSRWCTSVCKTLLANESATAFLPTCSEIVPLAAE